MGLSAPADMSTAVCSMKTHITEGGRSEGLSTVSIHSHQGNEEMGSWRTYAEPPGPGVTSML